MTDVLSDVTCELGESALWDGTSLLLGRHHRPEDLREGLAARSYPDPGDAGAGRLAWRCAPGAVWWPRCGTRSRYCDVDAGDVEIVCTLETDLAGNRFNDGAVDPQGRFWFGSMDLAETEPTGSFYCLHPDMTVSSAFGGIICSNGPAWSPDGRTMYHVDSTRRIIRAYDFDPATGTVGPGRVFVSDEGESWYPDGVTVDAEGFVWNCKWDGGRIVRYAPDGTVDRVVTLPVPRPTRCAFVGPDLSTLAVTSARHRPERGAPGRRAAVRQGPAARPAGLPRPCHTNLRRVRTG